MSLGSNIQMMADGASPGGGGGVLHSSGGFTISGSGGGGSPGRSTPNPGMGSGDTTGNQETRISPQEHKDSNGKTYWEKMQFHHVQGKSGSHIRIDVDRGGGVFLDHGELADLLKSDNDIDRVIQNAQSAISMAQATIRANSPDHYKWDPRKR